MFDPTLTARRLKDTRKKAGSKQAELAIVLKVDQSNVSDHENGQTLPSLKSLYAYSEFYNISADYFLGLIDEPRRLHPHAEDPQIKNGASSETPEPNGGIDPVLAQSIEQYIEAKLTEYGIKPTHSTEPPCAPADTA